MPQENTLNLDSATHSDDEITTQSSSPRRNTRKLVDKEDFNNFLEAGDFKSVLYLPELKKESSVIQDLIERGRLHPKEANFSNYTLNVIIMVILITLSLFSILIISSQCAYMPDAYDAPVIEFGDSFQSAYLSRVNSESIASGSDFIQGSGRDQLGKRSTNIDSLYVAVIENITAREE